MEFLICMLLAVIFTGGRAASDIIHGVKGTTPPHLEKARLKAQQAQQQKAPRERSTYADGKPRVKDVAAVYWGDAMASAIEAHNRRRAEKAGQRAENERAAAAGEEPKRVKPSPKDRAARWWRLLIDPVGEMPTGVGDSHPPGGEERRSPGPNGPQSTVVHQGRELTRFSWSCRNCPDRGFDYPTREAAAQAAETHDCTSKEEPMTSPAKPDTYGVKDQPADPGDPTAPVRPSLSPPVNTPVTAAPTGEAVNYETTVSELEALIKVLRGHVDSSLAAVAALEQAKSAISDVQVTYNQASQAAATIHQHLVALNLDPQTIGFTGTIADAMPPNRLDVMFDQLDAMLADANQQQANAEAALAAAEAALQTIQAKYGDANATVQGELGGDSRFLAGSGVNA